MGELIRLDKNIIDNLEIKQQARFELSIAFRKLRDDLYLMRKEVALIDREIAWLQQQLRRVNGE